MLKLPKSESFVQEYGFEKRRRREEAEAKRRREDLNRRRQVKLVRVQGQVHEVYQGTPPSSQSPVKIRLLCNDFSSTHFRCFSDRQIDVGTDVVVELLGAQESMQLRGRVVLCAPYTSEAKIVTHTNYGYRMAIVFASNADNSGVERLYDYSEEFFRKFLPFW